MSPREKIATDKESSFSVEEMFFSRTDTKGRILSGNAVFQRVSQFEWKEILGQPHNVIRHPDMPRGVFHLLWSYLKQGNPLGAYVKNMAKDGSYYWVYALAMPVEGGFLSVRLKPTSPLIATVSEAYAKLLQEEKTANLTPERSHERLLAMVNALGFPGYEQFMVHALMAELKARQAALAKDNAIGPALDGLIAEIQFLIESAERVAVANRSIFASYDENRYVSLNLQALSERDQDRFASLSVIAGQFQAMASEVEDQLRKMDESVRSIVRTIQDNQFLLLASALQEEMILAFGKEDDNRLTDRGLDQRLLRELSEQYRRKVGESLGRLRLVLAGLSKNVEGLTGMLNGLEIIRLNGKIETSRVNGGSGFAGVIEQLQAFLLGLRRNLVSIDDAGHGMQDSMERLLVFSQP